MKIKELGKKIKENKYSKYVVFIIVLFIITLLFVLINDDKVVSAISGYENNYSNEYVVEIKGEVNREGIYSISANARINDLIILANGLKQTADVSGINLASKVTDGMVLHIPAKKQTEEKNKAWLSPNQGNELKNTELQQRITKYIKKINLEQKNIVTEMKNMLEGIISR